MEKRESDMCCSKPGGSITLFLALILTLVFSLCFSLLEAARVQALSEIAARSLLLEMESAFGEYQPDLWKEYDVLFLDGGNDLGELDLSLLEGRRIEEAALGQKGTGFYQMALRNLEITGYTLATDDAGAAFEKQACAAIQAQLAEGAAELLQNKAKDGRKMADDSKNLEERWESAKDAMAEADEISEKQEADTSDESGNVKKKKVKASDKTGNVKGKKADASDKSENEQGKTAGSSPDNLPENPVDSVDVLKKSLTLDLVMENPAEISGKAITLSDTLAKRAKAQGNLKLSGGGELDKLWFLQYLNGYFSCGSGPGKKGSSEHALEYELEYCVAGKESDYKNLEKTVKELLLIREAGNFATIMQDAKKQALALEIATAAVGFTGLAPLIQAVKIGILLAWSYIESILDVRCLLSGGSVALVKAVSDWKSDVSLGEKTLSDKEKKTESKKDGLDYRGYLQILLLLVPERTLVYRAMDIIENNMACAGVSFRMDCLIHGAQAEALYAAEPLFPAFITTTKVKNGTYHFRENGSFAYLD